MIGPLVRPPAEAVFSSGRPFVLKVLWAMWSMTYTVGRMQRIHGLLESIASVMRLLAAHTNGGSDHGNCARLPVSEWVNCIELNFDSQAV